MNLPVPGPETPPRKRKQVLYIDDDNQDVEFLRHIFGASGVPYDLADVDSGTKALKYLRNESPYQKAPRPDLILLDLNMPGKDGYEVLAEIKDDNDLKGIPVIVFTSSDSKIDIARSHRTGADHFLTKPMGLEGYPAILEALAKFLPEQTL